MAENLLRLKVDSQEYDAKIKRAAEGIQHFVQNIRESGSNMKESGILARAFLQELGNMETVATGTKQQLREMSNALTTLTQTYRGLSDEEKQSGFGQELAKQIQILTERAGAAKDAMMDVEQSIKNAASDTRMFDQIAGGMTAMTATFQTATGAAKLFGIQMGDDVKVIADLQAAMAVTSGLQQLQNLLQKQSALMQGVNALQAEFNLLAKANPYALLATAVAAVAAGYIAWSSGAREAERAQKALNAELDNTKNALSQIDKDTDFSIGIAEASGKSWKAIHDLRLEAARTKLQLADMNYDKLAASGNASAEQMKQAAEMQKSAWDNVMKVLNEGTIHDIQKRNGTGPFATKGNKSANQEDTNYAADSIMAQEKEVQKLTDAWNRASASMRDGILKDLDAAKAKLEEMRNGTKAIEGGELGGVTVTGSKMTSINKTFRDAPVNFDSINTYISGVKDALKNANLGDFMYNKLTEKLKDATTVSTLLQNLMDLGVEGTDLTDAAEKLKGALLSGDIPDDKVKEYIDKLNEKIEEQGGVKLSYDPKTGKVDKDKKEESESEKEYKKFESKANQFIGGLSSVSSGLKGLGIEIPEEVDQLIGVMQSVMQVIQGVHSIIGVFQVSAIAANTAAVTANTTALIASSFIPFANGGIVPTFANGGLIGKAAGGMLIPGNSFSGDNLRLPVDGGRGMIGVNSGELILNASQQNNLANALTDNGMQGYSLETRVNGRDLVIVMNNDGTARGRGELVRTNRRG